MSRTSDGSRRLPSAASAAARTRSAGSVLVLDPSGVHCRDRPRPPVLQRIGQQVHQLIVKQVGLRRLLAQRLHDVDIVEDFGDLRVGECFGFALEYLAIADPISHRAPPSGDGGRPRRSARFGILFSWSWSIAHEISHIAFSAYLHDLGCADDSPVSRSNQALRLTRFTFGP